MLNKTKSYEHLNDYYVDEILKAFSNEKTLCSYKLENYIIDVYFKEHNFGVIITDDPIKDDQLYINYIKINIIERPDIFIIISKIAKLSNKIIHR